MDYLSLCLSVSLSLCLSVSLSLCLSVSLSLFLSLSIYLAIDRDGSCDIEQMFCLGSNSNLEPTLIFHQSDTLLPWRCANLAFY